MSQTKHRCGWVALMGPPNAGKSTLLNSYLGQKLAIVTPRPQTTRNQITGILSGPDAQIIFMDTPGIHQLRGKMNRLLLQSAWQAMDSADALLLVLDGDMYARKPEFLDHDVKPILPALQAEKRPVLIAVNKIDLLGDKSKLLPLLETLHGFLPNAEIFPVSALTRETLPALLEQIKKSVPEAPAQFPEDQLSTLPLRFMAAELIREKLFMSMRQELPYFTAVDIENWEEEPERNFTRINAVIYVGRASHKGMVIGQGGKNLKQVGQNARKEIEELLGGKVHLELWVKVKENWPEDLNFLHTLGLGRQE
ncbi:GTPase Era [Desulfovibrio sp. OttesenSCG-928-C14]|nr:GTPase Era [Desulfovibrio sp. OttesenSCG-928-C14]